MTEGTLGGPATRNVTARDIELEKVRNQGRLGLSIVRWLGVAVCIGVATFPCQFIYFAVKELAGKDTKLSVGITITLSVVGAAAMVKMWVDRKKMIQQSKEVIRLRERCAVLEDRADGGGKRS